MSRSPNSPRYHFKSRGAPIFYDETNNKSHQYNVEERRKEFLIERKNRDIHLYNKRVVRQIEDMHQQDGIAHERGTQRYLRLLNTC